MRTLGMYRDKGTERSEQSAERTLPHTVVETAPVCPSVFEVIFTRPNTLVRNYRAPLFKEREKYLRYQLALGRSRGALQNIAAELLHIVRVMQLTKLQPTSEREIREAVASYFPDEAPSEPGSPDGFYTVELKMQPPCSARSLLLRPCRLPLRRVLDGWYCAEQALLGKCARGALAGYIRQAIASACSVCDLRPG